MLKWKKPAAEDRHWPRCGDQTGSLPSESLWSSDSRFVLQCEGDATRPCIRGDGSPFLLPDGPVDRPAIERAKPGTAFQKISLD